MGLEVDCWGPEIIGLEVSLDEGGWLACCFGDIEASLLWWNIMRTIPWMFNAGQAIRRAESIHVCRNDICSAHKHDSIYSRLPNGPHLWQPEDS